jgi:hypothetical protein
MIAELPTVSETLPGFEMASWFGLLAPTRTAPAATYTRRLHLSEGAE